MTTLSEIGLKNFRRLKNMPPTRLAPITVLLGRNSIGKSTFARVFPLLRQSVERRKRSPLLWFGDLVDFGSIEKVIARGESNISLSFTIDLTPSAAAEAAWPTFSTTHFGSLPIKLGKVQVTLVLEEDLATKASVAKKLIVNVFGGIIEINLPLLFQNGNSILVNGVVSNSKDHVMVSYQGDFLPLIAFYRAQQNERAEAHWAPSLNPWVDNVAQIIKRYLHGNTSTATARRIAVQVPLGTVDEISNALPKIRGPHGWTSAINSSGMRLYLAGQFHHSMLLAYAGPIIEKIDTSIAAFFSEVRYIKPLRAIAERYYRRADLSVSEIDPEGRNLPMFLDSLNSDQMAEFRDWMKKYLDIDAYTQREGDQLTIMAKARDDAQAFNVADMGFGISQVLPIAAQLWATTQSGGYIKPASVVVLEQPELHLHPEYQARLADLFAGVVGEGGVKAPPIIIETHSQQIINRLGELIEKKVLAPSDVSILLFEKSDKDPNETSVRESSFDEKGVLQNWPFGFFEPEVR